MPAFDPSHLLTWGIGLLIGALGYFVRSTTDRKGNAVMVAITGQVQVLGDSVLKKIDELKDALHAVAQAGSVASAKHEGLAVAHDKLDNRVSRIEEHVFRARGAGEP